MKKIYEFINQYTEKATLKRALVATLIFGILLYIIDYSPIGVAGLLKLTGGANILDFENGYSLEKAYSILDALGENGRHFYLTLILPTDIFFPIGLMLFTSNWMSLFLKKLTKNGSILRWLTGITVINMLLDWSENIGITLMLIQYPTKLAGVCAISSRITTIKFVFVALIALSLVVLLVGCLIKDILHKVRRLPDTKA